MRRSDAYPSSPPEYSTDNGATPSLKETWVQPSTILGVAAGAFPAALAVVRLFVVSHGDATIFRTLLQTINIPAIAIDSISVAAPFIAATAVGLALFEAGCRLADRLGAKFEILVFFPGNAVLLPLAVWCILLGYPFFLLLAVGAVLGLSTVPMRAFLRQSPSTQARLIGRSVRNAMRDGWDSFLLTVMPYVILLIIVGAALFGALGGIASKMNEMWLPTEVIQEQSRTYHGYVLNAGDHYFTFLTRDFNEVKLLRADDVKERAICAEPDGGQLLQAKNNAHSGVPSCKDLLESVPK